MNKTNYPIYGTFRVTTEGDCEGKSTRDLGIYIGYVDEIALALADKCYYTLRFKLIEPKKVDIVPTRNKVKICLETDSNIWQLSNDELMDYFKSFFADRDVEVIETHGYGSCTISSQKETIEEKREKILSKLTAEEKQILGL